MSSTDELLSLLRTTLGKMEVALGAINDAIVWTSEQGHVQWCNKAFDALIGQRHLDVLGGALTHLFPLQQGHRPVPEELHPVSLAQAVEDGHSAVYEFQRDQRPRYLDIFYGSVRSSLKDRSLILVIRDVTEHHHAERLLKDKLAETESMNKMMMNREERILELKHEIEQLRHEMRSFRDRLPPQA